MRRPELPPSPIPPAPAFDKSFDGSRFLITFTLDSRDANDNHTLRAAMMLDPAHDSRFSSLRLNISLHSGTVLWMSEPMLPTSARDGSSYSLPLDSTSKEGESKDDHATPLLQSESQEDDQRTSLSHNINMVQVHGVGSGKGQWVLKEAAEDAAPGRPGFESRIVLEAVLDVKPSAIIFNVMVGTRVGGGKERAIQSGTLNAGL
ncbi:hypothetical protein HWV62_28088 [Athelia sp. TMB]|nr:hypothetical protein HWV62_28088 [Athelia sp. TMB]